MVGADLKQINSDISLEDYIIKDYIAAKLPEPYLEVIFDEETTAVKQNNLILNAQEKCTPLLLPFAKTGLIKAKLKQSRELVAASAECKKVVELTLELQDKNVQLMPDVGFFPGDSVCILPSNVWLESKYVLSRLQLEQKADECCRVQLKSTQSQKRSARVPSYIPQCATPRELLSDCLSLRVTPKKQLLRALAAHCSSPLEQQFLCCLSAKQGAHLYEDLIIQKSYNLLDILRLCPSCTPTLALLLEHLPRLTPRPYSISCSPLTSNGEIKLIYSVLPQRPGVTTLMLERLAQEALSKTVHVPIYLRQPNNFRFTTEDASRHNILIGVGTAVAPFLGFLQHKSILVKDGNVQLGSTWLYTGARTQQSAFARDTFKHYLEEGVLQRYSEAFSRETATEKSYKYVQDLLLARQKEFVQQLTGAADALLYVCADGAQISSSISDCIRKCLMETLSCDEEQACELLKSYKESGKYREDIWL